MSWFSSLKSVFSPAKEVNEEKIQEVLQNYEIPIVNKKIKDCLTAIQLQETVLQLSIKVFESDIPYLQQIHDDLIAQLEQFGIKELNLHVLQQKKPVAVDAAPKAKTVPQQKDIPPHPRIQHIILVSSGKGGVGKSTTTVNLALALKQLGKKVGVLDADIYGPSIPTMLGNAGKTPLIEAEQFVPLEAYGMPVLSIGHLTGDHNTPVAWRGPKATGALMQLFNQTLWPNLDILVVDMPPGTGDIQLTLAQRMPVTGAVIVTTPQNIALLDAVKGIELFNKVAIPTLGVVENMATHVCVNCGYEDEIFGHGGGENLSKEYDVPLLGQLPLSTKIRKNTDDGHPSVVSDDINRQYYMAIAENLLKQLEKLPKKSDKKRIF